MAACCERRERWWRKRGRIEIRSRVMNDAVTYSVDT